MREVIAADFFLFLRSVFMEDAEHTYYHWIPHSTVYMRGMPKFIIQSRGSKYANRLLPSLGVDTIPTFRPSLPKHYSTYRGSSMAGAACSTSTTSTPQTSEPTS